VVVNRFEAAADEVVDFCKPARVAQAKLREASEPRVDAQSSPAFTARLNAVVDW
jgi:hypothetical protein